MKKIIYKISAFLLSLLVLVSTMSFTVDKHYCGDKLVDVSYFGKADSCCMDGKKMHQEMIKKCCSNETIIIESSNFDKENILTLTPKNVEFLVFHIYSYINLYQEVILEKEFYKDFSPPDPEEDIQVLHQTFII